VTTRRVIIGKYADGVTYGLKAALPGFDALTEADNSPNLSFNSNWSDIAPVLQSGIVTVPTGTTIVDVLITDPGYVPYVEARKFDGGTTIHDDYLYGAANNIGVAAYYNRRSPLTLRSSRLNPLDSMIYVVFGVPVVLS
jgi:hypothetical protein